jgi:hypothetical protein
MVILRVILKGRVRWERSGERLWEALGGSRYEREEFTPMKSTPLLKIRPSCLGGSQGMVRRGMVEATQ